MFNIAEVKSNQQKSVNTEPRYAPEGGDLKAQMIGCGEGTVDGIVEVSINPELPPEEWDLTRLVEKKQFIYIWKSSCPIKLKALVVEPRKTLMQEQLCNVYDNQEGQIGQQRPCLMREAERQFIFQQAGTIWREHVEAMYTCENLWFSVAKA